jgi:uncharacterized protein YkwD
MVTDAAGNSLRQARHLTMSAAPITLSDFVGGGDQDFYRFQLSRRSSFNFNMTSAGGNADVELIQDRNGNGRVDPGEIVASSRAIAGRADAIRIVGLGPGTYSLRIFPKGPGTISYRLTASAALTPAADFAYRVVELTNDFRRQNGLLPLAVNTQIRNAAQLYSQTMAQQDFFDHVGRDGSLPWVRMQRAGYNYVAAAENLAAGHLTPAAVVQGWIDSPGHRRNLLNPNLREIGVGYFYLPNDSGSKVYQRYWTQKLGSPA